MAEVLSAWKHVCNGVFYSIRHVFSDREDFLRQGEKAHTVLIEGKIRGGRIFWKSIAVAGMENSLPTIRENGVEYRLCFDRSEQVESFGSVRIVGRRCFVHVVRRNERISLHRMLYGRICLPGDRLSTETGLWMFLPPLSVSFGRKRVDCGVQ